MQHTAIFEEQVALTPKDLRRRIDSIDMEILKKLQERLEGRCSRHGFVLPGKLRILSRSMGSVERGRFTGSVLFYVQAEGEVLNPPDGVLVEGTVIRKNKMGMYVSYEDAIRVIVPRDLHIGRDDFEAVEIGEKVQVEIKKSRFQVNDPFILSVGLFMKSVAKAEKAPAVPLEGEGEDEDEDAMAKLGADVDLPEDSPEEGGVVGGEGGSDAGSDEEEEEDEE